MALIGLPEAGQIPPGAEAPPVIDTQAELQEWLGEKGNEGRVVKTRLRAGDRVIARVTDGIYREPASALRELISNAWDADANSVTILTDAPRFSRIYVRDDGAGMSFETLSRLVHNIGDSSKRRPEGQGLGVTSDVDLEHTPGGRLLIGKIGIGLFSVSQLARRFRIVTKTKGASYRLIAEVRIRAYSEDGSEDDARDADDTYVSGEVLITREVSEDLSAHGTDIILEDVKPRVRDLLRSADRWKAIDEKEEAFAAGDYETAQSIRVEEPAFHAGWIEDLSSDLDRPAILARPPKFPWTADTPAGDRMSALMDAIEHQELTTTARPDLASTLDTYLETLWTLALSVPVGYVDHHPFDLGPESGVRLFWISNESRGQALELDLKSATSVRDAVKRQVPGAPELKEGLLTPAGGFRVTVDGIELLRPLRFRPVGKKPAQPMLFIGQYAPDLQRVNSNIRGGNFGLEGYLFWNGMVIPKENNGVLVRIRGAAGALFDSTFFKYQVSELTRLRQITSELFIRRGLDAALNIDRESFNFSHPHVQLVSLWLHRSLRQLTNKHKDLNKRARAEFLVASSGVVQDAVTKHSERVWSARQGTELPPEITISDDRITAELARGDGAIALVREDLAILSVTMPATERKERDAKAKALMRVLAAFEVLSDRSYQEQEQLIDAILTVFFPSPEK